MTRDEKIHKEFNDGLTAVGLARKYGKTLIKVEHIIRKQSLLHRSGGRTRTEANNKGMKDEF